MFPQLCNWVAAPLKFLKEKVLTVAIQPCPPFRKFFPSFDNFMKPDKAGKTTSKIKEEMRSNLWDKLNLPNPAS